MVDPAEFPNREDFIALTQVRLLMQIDKPGLVTHHKDLTWMAIGFAYDQLKARMTESGA